MLHVFSFANLQCPLSDVKIGHLSLPLEQEFSKGFFAILVIFHISVALDNFSIKFSNKS